jgi:hypothetical protein
MTKSTDNKEFLTEARLNSETRRERPKRRIVPSGVKVSKAPQLTSIINDALSIIGSELAMYSKKTSKGIALDLKEARIVSSYMDSLVKMSREAREAQKPEHLEHLSDEELMLIAQESFGVDVDNSED